MARPISVEEEYFASWASQSMAPSSRMLEVVVFDFLPWLSMAPWMRMTRKHEGVAFAFWAWKLMTPLTRKMSRMSPTRSQLMRADHLSDMVLRRMWARQQGRGRAEALQDSCGTPDEAVDSLVGTLMAAASARLGRRAVRRQGRRTHQGCSRSACKASTAARRDPPSQRLTAMAAIPRGVTVLRW